MNNMNFSVNSRMSRLGKIVCPVLSLSLLVVQATPESLFAADFAGKLKGVTVTDQAMTNIPPTAVIKYTSSGKSFNFDASGSTDPDGSIGEYRWDFGDGTTGSGLTATHQFTSLNNFAVTLSTVDNAGAVSISRVDVFSGVQIKDDFSTDTSKDYTSIAGAVSVAGGSLFLDKPWDVAMAYHALSLSGPNHKVEADVSYDGADGGGLIVRWNAANNTGYGVVMYATEGYVALNKIQGTTLTFLKKVTLPAINPGVYRMRVEAMGNTFKVYISNALVLEANDSTYSTGNSIGVMNKKSYHNAKIVIDNLLAADL